MKGSPSKILLGLWGRASCEMLSHRAQMLWEGLVSSQKDSRQTTSWSIQRALRRRTHTKQQVCDNSYAFPPSDPCRIVP